MIFACRLPLTLLLFAFSVAAGVYVFQELSLATKEVQLLRSSHQFSQYLEHVDLFRASPHRQDRMMNLDFYWGMLPADCTENLCYYDNKVR